MVELYHIEITIFQSIFRKPWMPRHSLKFLLILKNMHIFNIFLKSMQTCPPNSINYASVALQFTLRTKNKDKSEQSHTHSRFKRN